MWIVFSQLCIRVKMGRLEKVGDTSFILFCLAEA